MTRKKVDDFSKNTPIWWCEHGTGVFSLVTDTRDLPSLDGEGLTEVREIFYTLRADALSPLT